MGTVIWKPIPNHPLYEVSTNGEIRSWNKNGHGVRQSPVILACIPNPKGYRTVTLQGKSYTVHKIVAEAFLGACPSGMTVNHKNGIKHDNRVENLEYCTSQNNTLHSRRVLGKVTRESHPSAKLSERDVMNIKNQIGTVSLSELARRYGVTTSAIWAIKMGKSWQ